MKIRAFLAYSAAALLVLSGCDTNENSSGLPAKGNVNGVVVIPKLTDDNTTLASTCSNLPLPGGYLPLADANVSFVDENGTAVFSQMTDSCGRFYGDVSTEGLTMVRIVKDGYRTMLSDVSFFDNGGDGWGIVSTVDVNNSFAVRVNTEGESLTYNSRSGLFKYSVVDTKTGRAVLGIPRTNVRFYRDRSEMNVTDYIFNDLEADLVLTLDASGSMEAELTDANGTNIGTGFDVTYKAAKTFIDELSGNSQLGINIFDDKISFIDRAFISSLNLSGTFLYAADGFERNKKNSKFIIDIYHPKSHVYDMNSTLVPEYPYTTTKPYEWGGLTAYIDAASTAVSRLNQRSAERKITVLMTDGGDNSSTKTISQVITEALNANVTFYTISMGSFTDTNLQSLAQATGGIYIKADGSDLSQTFADILGEIQYFYEIGAPVEANTTAYYRVDVTLDGETVSGLVELNTSVVPSPYPPGSDSEAAQLYTKCIPCHGSQGLQSAYGVTGEISLMMPDTLKQVLTDYRDGGLDQFGYGSLMTQQLANYTDSQIDLLSQYIPTLALPDVNVTEVPETY